MKPSRYFVRTPRSYSNPSWTEEETIKLIEAWGEVESHLQNIAQSCLKIAGGVDRRIALKLSTGDNKTRTVNAINIHRTLLYEVVRFINRFDETRQSSGGPFWFDLSKREREKVKIPARIRKVCFALPRKSYSALVKLKSVRKWTKVRRVVGSRSKTREAMHPDKCNSCWSASEVKALVSSWSLVMKKSSTSVSAFLAGGSDAKTTLYTPWNHSTMSSWRKMKRLATSYLFIQHFNQRHSPANWFQLSDGTQNMWIDWKTLPPDFEDIDRDLFDDIRLVDTTQEGSTDKAKTMTETESSFDNENFSAFDNCPSPDESEGFSDEFPVPTPTLRAYSPHLPSTSISTQQGAKRNQDHHRECNALCEHIEKLQKKQFKQAIQRLRSEIERDVRLSTDMTRAIFFERLGNPGQSGDATFVANLLDDQQQQIQHHFAEFHNEQFCTNDYVFDTSLDG